MIRLNFDIFFRIFCDLVAELKSTNFKFVVKAKPELPALVQSILQNYSMVYMQLHRITEKIQCDQETVTKRCLADS